MSVVKKSNQKYETIKNNFTICQIKKFIGKKIIIVYPSINITNQIKVLAKNVKSKILEEVGKTNKNLIITAVCLNGILHVIKNVEIFLAINSISYKEIEKFNKSINITIIQYPQLSKSEIKALLI